MRNELINLKIRKFVGGITAIIALSLVAVSPASAADTIYLDGNLTSNNFFSSSQKPSISGGRAFNSGKFLQLKSQTLYGGVVQYSVTGTNGAAADHSHGRVNRATERCNWLMRDGTVGPGSVYMICKYRT